jgi:hypothetical protein
MDEQRSLEAMTTIEALSAELGTRAYVWGGWSLDIHQGRVTREHSDIDCFVVDLYRLFAPFRDRLLEQGWETRDPLDGHLLGASRDGIRLALGHVELEAGAGAGGAGDGGIVNWKHNGNRGSILFPAAWLRREVVPFLGVELHIAEPELAYVLKTNPHLMNPDWSARDRDRADIALLRAMLAEKRVDLDTLLSQVQSVCRDDAIRDQVEEQGFLARRGAVGGRPQQVNTLGPVSRPSPEEDARGKKHRTTGHRRPGGYV